jgi:D-methionine transport system substrate-binding protein
LILLQSVGLITLKSNAGAAAGPADVTANSKHLQFRELEAAQLPRSLADVDVAVVNANFALDAGLNPMKDALYHESPDSKYVNVLAVNAGKENDPRVQALVRALHSDAIRQFIQTRYKGSVTPAF